MKLLVRQTLQLTDSVKSFVLAREHGEDLPEFRPGAHIALTLRAEGKTLVRRYSLVSDPANRGEYQIAVLRDPASTGGSKHLHDSVHVGDFIEVAGPHSDLQVAEDARHSVLIAGGIGVTPMLSLLRALTTAGRSVEMHYASRRHTQCAFHDEIKTLAGERAMFYFNDLGKSLDLAALFDALSPDTHVYVCGPRGLIDAVRTTAQSHGHPRSGVHFESFGPRWSPSDKPVDLTLAQSGLTLRVDPGTTLLDAMIEAGAFVPYECKRGECATCVATVLDGEIDHRDLCLDDKQRSSSVCTCVSWPRGGRLVLDM